MQIQVTPGDLDFLQSTLEIAGGELVSRFGTKQKKTTKKDTSIVTEADLASEKIILERLRIYYPEDITFSEEAGLSSEKRHIGSYVWVIDPLDGTTNFSNHYPFYSISIARCIIDEDLKLIPVIGGIAEPERQRIFSASLRGGAFCQGEKLSVAKDRAFQDSFLVTGFYYHRGQELKQDFDILEKVAQLCQSVRRDGSAALDLAYVAQGTFDAFWECGLKPWDIAAGSLLVREAGGVVANYQSHKSFDIEGFGIACGRESAVQTVLETIGEAP